MIRIVVWPKTEDEVVKVLRLSLEMNAPFTIGDEYARDLIEKGRIEQVGEEHGEPIYQPRKNRGLV
jgi:hypothetical protein